MHICFNFNGSSYQAGLAKQDNNKIVVLFNDDNLEKKFGSSLPFYVENKSVGFETLNRSHSDLFALNSTISRAISEQCREIL